MLRLQTLGALGLHGGDEPALSSRRKELVLLAYLARRGPRPLPRAEAAALLWPDRDERHARQSLRQALLELRHAVGEGLSVEPDRISLATGAVELDADLFEREIEQGDPAAAVRRWGGDFLPGAEDVGGEELRAWLEGEREGLRRRLRGALAGLVEEAHRRSAWEDGVAWAERWTTALPDDHQGYQALLQSLYLDGQAAEALARYASLTARLRAQQMAPPADLEQLGRLLERAAAPAAEARAVSAALFTPDLVGRGPALAELSAAWRTAMHERSVVVLIEGEAGIGKSRLGEEFLRRVERAGDGVTVCRVRAGEGAGTSPLGTAALLATALSAAPGLGGTSRSSLAGLGSLAPALRKRFDLTDDAAERSPADLAEAFREAVAAVTEERPLLLLIDDYLRADSASRQVLDGLIEHPPPRCLIVLTARTGEQAPRATFPSGVPLRRLKLQPLALSEVELLVGSILELAPDDRHRLATRLHAQGGGNPFYAVELISALADDGTLSPSEQGAWRLAAGEGPLPLPTTVRDVIARRVAPLSPNGRAALEAAAVLGIPFDRELVTQVAGVSPSALDAGLDELILHRLIRESGAPGRYEFAHELVRRHVDQSLPVAVAERYSSRALAALSRRSSGDQAAQAAIAHHRARAGAVTAAERRTRRRRWAAVAGVAVAAVVLVALARGRSTPATNPSSIAVLPFAVSGSNDLEYLRDGMATLLSTDLNGAGSLRSADPRAVLGISAQLPQDLTDIERGRRVAERLGAGTYVVGHVVEGRGRIRINAAAYGRDPAAGPIAEAEVDGPPDRLFELVDAVAGRLLTGLNPGPYAQLARTAAITTGSLPALKSYLEGERLFRSGEFHPAARAFQRAIAEDTTFALAYYWSSVASWWADDSRAIDSAAALAVKYGERLSQRDRRLFQAWEAFLRGDPVEAERVYRLVVGLEPENVEAWLQLGEVRFHSGPRRGQPIGGARPAFERVVLFEPEHTSALLHLARIAAAERRTADLNALVERILALSPTGEWAVEARALRAYATGDRAEQRAVVAELRTAPEGRVWNTARYVAVGTHEFEGATELVRLLTQPTRPAEVRAFGHLAQAHLAVARGRLRQAESELARAAALDPVPALEHRSLLALLPFVPVSRDRLLALRDSVAGSDANAAGTMLETSHLAELHDGVHLELRAYLLATLSLRLGDTATARASLPDLTRPREVPAAAAVARDAAGSVRARLAAQAGRPREALSELEEVQRLEARVGLIGGSPFYSQGLERFLYAELLEREGRLEEALRWYDSFSSNSIFDFVYLGPAHAARGRVYERLGRRADAARQYRRAEDILAPADPELAPLLESIREGVARTAR